MKKSHDRQSIPFAKWQARLWPGLRKVTKRQGLVTV
jgi:hypothetical protein